MRRALSLACVAFAGSAFAQGPPLPPEALQPVAEEPGILLTPSRAALVSMTTTLLGVAASLAWTAGGRPRSGPGLGMAAFALLVAPSTGRIAVGDESGSARHLGIRGLIAGAGAVAGSIAALAQRSSDETPAGAIAFASVAGAGLFAEAIWDVSSTADLPAAGFSGRRIHLSIAPLASGQLLQARAIPPRAPVLPETESAYALPGFGVRAAVEGGNVAAGMLFQWGSVTGYPLYDTTQNAGCVGPAPPCAPEPQSAYSLKMTAMRLLFTLEGKWPVGAVLAGGVVGLGVGSTSTRLTTRGRVTGALYEQNDEEQQSELVVRLGPAVEWPLASFLSLRGEATFEARAILDTTGGVYTGPSSGPQSPGIGGSVLLGVVARL